MNGFVVDASVAAKWCFPEPDSEIASRLLNRDVMLYAPDLLYAEVGNVAWKHCQRQLCTPQQAQQALELLMQANIETSPVADLMISTLQIASTYGRSFYDAAYLALAVGLGMPLVTADEKFANAMARTPFKNSMISLSKY